MGGGGGFAERSPRSALSKEGMDKTTELLIVDDNSRDGSVEMVETLQKEGFPIRIHVRTNVGPHPSSRPLHASGKGEMPGSHWGGGAGGN